MEYYRIFLYVLLGVLPSLTWLLYYLHKDVHPEPKRMILKIFLYGAIITVPVFFVQVGLSLLLSNLQATTILGSFPVAADILRWFIAIALTEEIAKYFVIRTAVFNSAELDEPLDLMLYMVIVSLGFAAFENILYLFSPIGNASVGAVVTAALAIIFVRFIGATFLHTLCSGLLGYFLALSYRVSRGSERIAMAFLGITLATLLHGFYDFSIVYFEYPANLAVPATIVVALILLVMYFFEKTKKIKSVCKI